MRLGQLLTRSPSRECQYQCLTMRVVWVHTQSVVTYSYVCATYLSSFEVYFSLGLVRDSLRSKVFHRNADYFCGGLETVYFIFIIPWVLTHIYKHTLLYIHICCGWYVRLACPRTCAGCVLRRGKSSWLRSRATCSIHSYMCMQLLLLGFGL